MAEVVHSGPDRAVSAGALPVRPLIRFYGADDINQAAEDSLAGDAEAYSAHALPNSLVVSLLSPSRLLLSSGNSPQRRRTSRLSTCHQRGPSVWDHAGRSGDLAFRVVRKGSRLAHPTLARPPRPAHGRCVLPLLPVSTTAANARCISYTDTPLFISDRPQLRRVFFSPASWEA